MRETALETCAPTFPQGVLYERFFSKSHFLIGHWHNISEAEAKKSHRPACHLNPTKLLCSWPRVGCLQDNFPGTGKLCRVAQTALASSHRGSLTLIYKKIKRITKWRITPEVFGEHRALFGAACCGVRVCGKAGKFVAAYGPSNLLESPRLALSSTTLRSMVSMSLRVPKISRTCTALDRTEAIIGLAMTVMRHIRPDLESSVSRCGEAPPAEKTYRAMLNVRSNHRTCCKGPLSAVYGHQPPLSFYCPRTLRPMTE